MTIHETTFTEPSLLIRVNRLYRENMTDRELYEITRGVWVAGPKTRDVKYAFLIYKGIIKEAYEVLSWHKYGTLTYRTRVPKDDGGNNLERRWEFKGKLAPSNIREKYKGVSVKDYFKPGQSNPVFKVGY